MAMKPKNINKSYYFPFVGAKEGYQEMASSKNAPLDHLSVARLRINKTKGKYSSYTKKKEVLLHLLVGQCNIEVSNKLGKKIFTKVGGRTDIFSELSESLVLSPNTEYKVEAKTKTVDIVICEVDFDGPDYKPTLIKKNDVDVRIIGEAHYKREVRVILGGEGPAKKLRGGETINGVGLWSSWPHHSFDVQRNLYPDFEEVFLFFIKPKEAYGLVRMDGIFCNGQTIDSVIAVKNGDWGVMPIGNHPVVSGPASQILYFWIYISPIPKIYAKWAEDQGGYA